MSDTITRAHLILLNRCQAAADHKEALTLTADEMMLWRALCAAGLGATYWSWRPQDRDWKNPSEELRFATKLGQARLRTEGA